MSELQILHANDLQAAEWLESELASRLGPDYPISFAKIPSAGSPYFLRLSEPFQRLLRLDKPDLVVTNTIAGRANPLVSIEVTTTTPHGQHGKQRFARLAAAAELGIPSVYIIPFSKSASVKGKPHRYNLGSDIPFGLLELSRITDCPSICFAFPDNAGELVVDKRYPGQPDASAQAMRECFDLLREVILLGCQGRSITTRTPEPNVKKALRDMEVRSVTPAITDYTTATLIATTDLQSYLEKKTSLKPNWIANTLRSLPPRFMERAETLIFHPDGRLFEKAGDPYCGMFAWFDFAFCRVGRSPEERKRNLLYMPVQNKCTRPIGKDFAGSGYQKFWLNDSALRHPQPESVEAQYRVSHELRYGGIFLMIKPLRVYGYLADMIVFRDALLPF